MTVDLLVAALAVGLGAAIQSAGGMGLAVVSLPVLALVMPDRMPQVLLLLAMPMLGWMVQSERHHVRAAGLAPVVAGRFLGTLPGTWIVTVLSGRQLALFFAAASIAAGAGVLATARTTTPHTPGPLAALGGGVASGVMGTAAGVGGPPLAWLYAGREGADIRANLSVVFLTGNVVSLASLAWAGRLGTADIRTAILLLLPLGLGVAAGAQARLRLTRIHATRLLVAVVVGGAASLTWSAVAPSG